MDKALGPCFNQTLFAETDGRLDLACGSVVCQPIRQRPPVAAKTTGTAEGSRWLLALAEPTLPPGQLHRRDSLVTTHLWPCCHGTHHFCLQSSLAQKLDLKWIRANKKHGEWKSRCDPGNAEYGESRKQRALTCQQTTAGVQGDVQLFSPSVTSDSLRPRGLQHTFSCPSLSPGACTNSCPSSQ